MNIRELIAYSEQPVLQPLLLEVGTLLLKVIYGIVDKADIDKAKNLVYNAGIKADWLEILAEGNPSFIDDVVEQVNYDLCLSDETSLINTARIVPGLDLDAEERQYLATEFGVEIDEDEIS